MGLNALQEALVGAGVVDMEAAREYAQPEAPLVNIKVDFHLYEPEARVYVEDGVEAIPDGLVRAVSDFVGTMFHVGYGDDCDVSSVVPVLFCTHGLWTTDRRRCVTVNCRNSMVAFDVATTLEQVALKWGFGVTRVTVPQIKPR